MAQHQKGGRSSIEVFWAKACEGEEYMGCYFVSYYCYDACIQRGVLAGISLWHRIDTAGAHT